jgi:hypothetical protein
MYYIGEEDLIELKQKLNKKSYCGFKYKKNEKKEEASIFYSTIF